MNRVVDVLMRRDGLSESEAIMEVDSIRNEIEEELKTSGNYIETFERVEEILHFDLGLEMDYLFDIIGL